MTLCDRCGGARVVVVTCTLDCGDGVSVHTWEELADCPVCVTGEEEPAWMAEAPDVEEEVAPANYVG